MAVERWFYSRQGQTQGPFSRDQIKSMAQNGELLPSDELWLEGHAKRLAGDYKGLLPEAAPVEVFSEPQPKPPATAAKTSAPAVATISGRTFVVLLAVVAVIVALLWNNSARNAAKPIQTPAQAAVDWAAVKVACEAAVREKLKAPSTAQFPSALEAQEGIVMSGDTGTWSAWVDAENSFGAMIRTEFECVYGDGVAVATFP